MVNEIHPANHPGWLDSRSIRTCQQRFGWWAGKTMLRDRRGEAASCSPTQWLLILVVNCNVDCTPKFVLHIEHQLNVWGRTLHLTIQKAETRPSLERPSCPRSAYDKVLRTIPSSSAGLPGDCSDIHEKETRSRHSMDEDG